MKAVNRVLQMFVKALNVVMVALLVLMVIVMFMQVFMRYVLQTGFSWSEELARFSMIYLIYISSIVLTSESSHISVTILEDSLKGVPRKATKLIQYLIFIGYSVFMTKIGMESLDIVRRQTSPNMMITMDLIYGIIPVCTALMVVYLIVNIINLFVPQAQKPVLEEGSHE